MAQPDVLDLSHRRNVLAALVTASIPENIIEKVHLNYRKGRLGPWDTRLEIIRPTELFGADITGIKNYAQQHFALDPGSHIIPCFYIVFDDRTAIDESVLFVQQDWPGSPDETMRTMPQHVFDLYNGFLMFEEEFERCREEDLNEDGVYDPSYFDLDNRIGRQSLVRFSKTHARLANEDAEVQTYVLAPLQAQALGLSPVERTVELRRGTNRTFDEKITLKVDTSDIRTSSDQVQVWGPSDYFVWGRD